MICKCCKSDKSKEYFSKSQLKKKTNDRKCIDCYKRESNNFTLETQKELFSNFIKWLCDNGAKFPNLNITHYNENFRGIITNKNIHAGKVILNVPHSCIITTIKAKKSQVGIELENSGFTNHSSHTWLALYILQEKLNPTSFWKPYLDILPPSYDDFPQFYSSDELKQLTGSFVLDMIRSRNLNLEKEYNELVAVLPIFGKKMSLRDYIWVRIAIVSRVFQINLSKNENTQGLVPMADMLNHSKTPGTRWSYVPDDDAFVIVSDSFIFKGKEVFDTYGPKCNSRYLVNYGFTLKDNHENNQAAIFIDPEKLMDMYKSSHKETKLKLIDNNYTTIDDSYCEYSFLIEEEKETKILKDNNFRFQFMKLLNQEVTQSNKTFTGLHSTWCLFGFLRVLLSNEQEFENIMKIINDKTNQSKKLKFTEILLIIPPQSINTELLVLKVLANNCESVLEGFSTLVEKDEKELETTEPYSNRWNILNMLIGEKKTLLFYRDLEVFVNKLWQETGSKHKVGRFLRKHELYSPYYKFCWSKIL